MDTCFHYLIFKGIIHPKMKYITHLLVSKIHKTFFHLWNANEDIWIYFMNVLYCQSFGCIDFQWRDRNPSDFIKNILCSEDKQKSYGFGTTWGWVIDDRISIFEWTVPLMYTEFFVVKSAHKQHIKAEETVIGRFTCPSAVSFCLNGFICVKALFLDEKYPHIIYALKINGKRFWRHLIICISIRKSLVWKLGNRCVCWFSILCPLADDGKLSFEEFKAYFADGILTTDELRELFYSIDGRQTKYILQPSQTQSKFT